MEKQMQLWSAGLCWSYRVDMTRSTCARPLCCSHLRFTWQVLTVLTVLCVGLQLLGVVRQARNTKVIGPADEQSGISRLPAEGQAGTMFRSIPTTLDPYQRVDHLFQWKNDKTLDTTPARRLKSTHSRVLMPNGYQLASKASLPTNPEDEPWVHPEVIRQSPPQNAKSENLPKTLPEVSSKDKPGFLHSEVFMRSSTLKPNMPRKSPKVLQEDLQQSKPYRIPINSNNQAVNVLSHDESGVCRPKNHIVFLKTHKTASSTILNILYRYGDTRNLTFALPSNMHSQLFYPYFFMSHFVEGIRFHRVTKFHIMCNHMRFHGLEVRKVMPVDTFYFSILRNPVSMMESIFTYYKSIPAFQKFQTLTDFLLDGGRSYNPSLPNNHYALNLLTFDFGMDNSPPANEMELDERSNALIAAVESNFHLILISEYFDESMILLKHSLCWTLEDVVSFRLNSRSEKSRSKLSPDLAELVKHWNSLDWRLYQHFNATFWLRVDTMLGRTKLQEEVELLRARRAELEQTCLLGGGAVDPEKIQDISLKPFQYGAAIIQGYNIRPGLDNDTHHLCEKLITPELQYTSTLYAKQFPDLVTKHQTKMATARRSSAPRRTRATTRHSANINSISKDSLQNRTVAVHNMHSQSNTNPHLQQLDRVNYANTLAKHSIVIKSNANTASVARQNIQSDPSEERGEEKNILTQT